MIKQQDYNLPDQLLLNKGKSGIQVWKPDKIYVILGQRDNINDAIEHEPSMNDGVIVMQRPSGGHSVVLTPKMIVVSMISSQYSLSLIKSFFHDCNMIIINSLEAQGVHGLSIKGISDIVLNGRKIVGSSMYKGKDFLFFHAVVNVAESVETISKYLKHPMTEPEYRKGRNHLEFITSLAAENYQIDEKKLISSLNSLKMN
jgi:lipoate-protein ligase A